MTASISRSNPRPPALESKKADKPAPTQRVSQRPAGCWQKFQRYAASTFPFIALAFTYVHSKLYPAPPAPKKKGPLEYMDMHLKNPNLTTADAKACYIYISSGYFQKREKLDKSPNEILKTFWERLIAIQAKAKMPPVARAINQLDRLLQADVAPSDAKAMLVGIEADINRLKDIKEDPLYQVLTEKLTAVRKKAATISVAKPSPTAGFRFKSTPKPLAKTVQPVIGIESGSPNNCWINATLQYLNCNPHIRAWILGEEFPKDLSVIPDFLTQMEEDRRGRMVTCANTSANIRVSLQKRFPRDFSFTGQEDANVFFTHMMGFLEKRVGREFTYADTPLVTHKRIYRTYKWGASDAPPLKGPTEHHRMSEVNLDKREGIAPSPAEVGANEISLQLPDDDQAIIHGKWAYEEDGAKLIRDAFSYKQRVEQNYQTAKGAKTFIQDSAEVRFQEPPTYLFVRADRFHPDGRRKRNIPINMPLSPVTVPGKHFSYSLDPIDHPDNQRYELFGVVRHISGSGSARSGHYISYIKKEGRWYELNDDVASPISDAKAAELFKSAYLYQFRRVT